MHNCGYLDDGANPEPDPEEQDVLQPISSKKPKTVGAPKSKPVKQSSSLRGKRKGKEPAGDGGKKSKSQVGAFDLYFLIFLLMCMLPCSKPQFIIVLDLML